MSIETIVLEERERLPDLELKADLTIELEEIATFGVEAEAADRQNLAFLPAMSDALVESYLTGAQYGEFSYVQLPSRETTFFAFETEYQRDQFCADLGATGLIVDPVLGIVKGRIR